MSIRCPECGARYNVYPGHPAHVSLLPPWRRWWNHFVDWLDIIGPTHNHPEGSWRADCPACGLPRR